MARFPDVDPARQAEAHQLALDKFEEHLPRCDCCRCSVYPGEVYYELPVKKEIITVCSDCMIKGETAVGED